MFGLILCFLCLLCCETVFTLFELVTGGGKGENVKSMCVNIVCPSKVVCNDKEGGPGRWQTFAIGLGQWRSSYVCLLI